MDTDIQDIKNAQVFFDVFICIKLEFKKILGLKSSLAVSICIFRFGIYMVQNAIIGEICLRSVQNTFTFVVIAPLRTLPLKWLNIIRKPLEWANPYIIDISFWSFSNVSKLQYRIQYKIENVAILTEIGILETCCLFPFGANS